MRAEGSPINTEDANWKRTKRYITDRIETLRDALEEPQSEIETTDARARIMEWRRFLAVVEPPQLDEDQEPDTSFEMRFFEDRDTYAT